MHKLFTNIFTNFGNSSDVFLYKLGEYPTIGIAGSVLSAVASPMITLRYIALGLGIILTLLSIIVKIWEWYVKYKDRKDRKNDKD